MKVKALKSFAGLVCMRRGEEKDIKGAVAEDLIRAGYVERCTPSKKKEAKKNDDC